jgi:hypothetical protein
MKYVLLFAHVVLLGPVLVLGFAVGLVVFSFYAGLLRAKDVQMWLTR